MATEIWVNIGSGNGLLPDGTKPLPEPMLSDHQWSPSDIHSRAISQEMPQPSITKIRLKITYLTFHSHFPGANALSQYHGCWCTDFMRRHVSNGHDIDGVGYVVPCFPPRVMMTSSNGNIFRVAGPLCGEFTGHRWIPLAHVTKAIDAELWCFFFDLHPYKQLSKQSWRRWFETPSRLLWRHFQCFYHLNHLNVAGWKKMQIL